MVRYIATVEEYRALRSRANVCTIVDFTAEWCGPCQAIAPTFAALAEQHERAGEIEFFKVDVDSNCEAAQESGVTRMPTFQVWTGERLVATLEGSNPEKLRQLVLSAEKKLRHSVARHAMRGDGRETGYAASFPTAGGHVG